MGWGSIFQRRIRIFTIAIVMFTEYKVLQLRERWTKRPKMFELWKKAHERNAKRILDLIVQLEGLWVKLGQYLSTRVDVLPPAYIQLLKQLEDSLPPRPLEEVRKTISREFGKTVEELFLNFERIPLTTAADAQVHRATLSDGLEVVVKVQHDGIKEIILEDLKILKSVVYWVAWAEPKYDFNPIIDEWCKEAPKELDFNHEAENKRAVCKNHGWKSSFGDSNTSRVDVLIPEPIMVSTKKVLILEYMDGISLTDTESLEAFGIDKQKVLKEITRAYAHQIFVDGFFSGDPKPGNFLVSKVSPHRPILLDFGLKRSLSLSEKQALAKIFLASAEGDHVGLLSSFAEMGHKPRLNIPDQMLEISTSFFLNSAAAEEAHRLVEAYAELRNKNLKVFQEKNKHNEKEVGRFDPVDAFPSDIITFSRVVHLLRGLSSTMGAPLLFIDVMTPFAESVLQCPFNTSWMSGTPSLSNVEEKLRKLLIELGNAGEVLGIQVCAYKDGEVIIDTVAGVLGKHDPRPVQPDSLFPLFSVSKGIAAGMVHWLVDKGVLNLEDNVGDIWPQFRCNGKDQIKVHHVLNHTSGLHNALGNALDGDAQLMMDWEECLNRIASYTPETEPGREQLYHFVSFGWLCGGIIEHGSKKQFQKVLEEAFVHPLNIDGELYIGIPPGVESRLASLTMDIDHLKPAIGLIAGARPDLPSVFRIMLQDPFQMADRLPRTFNSLLIRRAISPAANGHSSARALARYYAALVDRGAIPPPHSSYTQPPLGSHKHGDAHTQTTGSSDGGKLFTNGMIHDAFTGTGEYENLAVPGGIFGLGFKRAVSKNGDVIGFGHSGIGGSTGMCSIEHRFAIAVTLNKMNFGTVAAKVIHLVCSELNIPFESDGGRGPAVN